MNITSIKKEDQSIVIDPNGNHSKMSKIERYGWNINTGEPGVYMLVDKMLLEISGDYQRHKDAGKARKALEVSLTAAKTGPITNDLLTGVYYLIDKCQFTDQHAIVIAKLDEEILQTAIRKAAAISGKGGEKVYASGVATAINAAKRRNVPKLEVI